MLPSQCPASFVGHHLRLPGRLPDQLDVHLFETRPFSPEGAFHAVRDRAVHRAGHRGHGHAHEYAVPSDPEFVDQPQVDDVESDFRIDHPLEHGADDLFRHFIILSTVLYAVKIR